jgi:hypothetical protein
MASEAD